MDRERMGVKTVSGCDRGSGARRGWIVGGQEPVGGREGGGGDAGLLIEMVRDADGELALAEERGHLDEQGVWLQSSC